MSVRRVKWGGGTIRLIIACLQPGEKTSPKRRVKRVTMEPFSLPGMTAYLPEKKKKPSVLVFGTYFYILERK